MGIPVDIANLPKWEVYDHPASWPGSPDALFIVAAATRILNAKFGMEAADIATDPDSEGYRNEIAGSIAGLLTSGSLIATSRRVGGSRQQPIAPTEWTPLTAHRAVATGLVLRNHGRSRDLPHWVFVGARETTILETLYRATDMLHPPEDVGPTEHLGETVLAAVSAMARNPATIAADDFSSAAVRLLQPHSVWTLHPDDRDAFVAAAAPWLVEMFGDPDTRKYDYNDFENAAIEHFAPFMTGRLFEKVWLRTREEVGNAVAQLSDIEREKAARGGIEKVETSSERELREAAEALAPHANRFRSGPNASQ